MQMSKIVQETYVQKYTKFEYKAKEASSQIEHKPFGNFKRSSNRKWRSWLITSNIKAKMIGK